MTKQPDLFDKLTAKADELRAHAKRMERQAARLAKAKAEEREARITELELCVANALALLRTTIASNGADAQKKAAVRRQLRGVLEQRDVA